MNVWLLKIGESLPLRQDTRRLRTANLADSLIARGHKVLWWTSAFDHLRKSWVFDNDRDVNLYPGLYIKAIKGISYRKNFSIARFIDHRIIASKFRKFARDISPPNIIVSAMPAYDLALEAVLFAKEKDIPVLIDIRDQWPEIFLDKIPKNLRNVARFALHHEFSMLRKLLSLADGIISMSDVLLDWGLSYAERTATWKDKVFYLGSSKFESNGALSNNIHELSQKLTGKFVVTFIGTFAMYHNPSILIECARKIDDEDIVFVLAGDGELLDPLKKQASVLQNVFFTGWINQYEISSLLKISNVGVCPTGNVSNKAFFPNKAFLYWSSSLPILSSFQGEIERVIERSEVGYTYLDIESLISGIKNLKNNTDTYEKMRENARILFNEKYEANRIYSDYAIHIEKIVADFHNKKI